jgi:DNA invertase Pin-like site-specific DNA recombinase
MRQYVRQRKWKLVLQVEEVGSGSKLRPRREELLKAARRREVVAIVVWNLDRWGRSLPGLISTLAELRDLGIAFVSLTEALDFTTSAGRAMIGCWRCSPSSSAI